MSDEPVKDHVSANRIIGRRLSTDADQPEVLFVDAGVARFTLNAFLDKRGPVSVDMLWTHGQASRADRHKTAKAAAQVCQVEQHSICGWATCKVELLLARAGRAVESVMRSPTGTNPAHADVVGKPHVRAGIEGDAASGDKAWAFAVVLKDFFNEHGEYIKCPGSQ